MTKAIMLAAAAALWCCSAAAAAECVDEVSKLAGDIGVSTELPQAQINGQTGAETNGQGPDSRQQPSAGATATSRDLAESGGVVAPPDTGSDMPVIKPPATGDAMPTAPEIAPQAGAESGGEADAIATEAARKTQIQSLLVAARQAAESGDIQACLDRLQKAKGLLAGTRQ
jgi:hypothetical protein